MELPLGTYRALVNLFHKLNSVSITLKENPLTATPILEILERHFTDQLSDILGDEELRGRIFDRYFSLKAEFEKF